MMVLVTGGCGYKGAVLVPKLLRAGHHVSVVDLQWFGNSLAEHPNLRVYQADFRSWNFLGPYEAIIHLAGVANDPAGELDPRLTWEINALGTMQLAELAAMQGVRKFIYASSGSVYGVSDDPEVTEDSPLVPLTAYNKSKAVAERCVLSYQDEMCVQIVRPGTVVGYSPRQRLDITLNGMVIKAIADGVIKVDAAGQRIRPYTHIDDICAVYLWLLGSSEPGTWNAGFENMAASEVAAEISKRFFCRIEEATSNDPRNYRMNSQRILGDGFLPKLGVRDAIDDLITHYAAGLIKNTDQCHNIRSMPRDC